jgi:hypothetical protein
MPPKVLPKIPAPDALAYSVESLARVTDLGRQLIYDEIKDGRLVARKIRRRTVIRRVDAELARRSPPAEDWCGCRSRPGLTVIARVQ